MGRLEVQRIFVGGGCLEAERGKVRRVDVWRKVGGVFGVGKEGSVEVEVSGVDESTVHHMTNGSNMKKFQNMQL